ncbi:sensor histidine kinase [Malaciobacter molluscorum LMG 25693]|uniref:Sensor histidine kinase n=1 Tax=Malaciobacter molluscorum LMG 25693 TaxID=870501 RepID=A0A2G1DIC5_9BACT|nr:histidine kinase [Malaciobacter molluscorum]AXX93039.1 two-component system sensor histidine kinase, LytS/YehU family [Malaciobacter molluscorum LMG 25693]PHO18096.1 sensor histidine kinase [Malaciobacter molluscorum LMG 25693]
MRHLELQIRLRDWFFIFIIALLFSTLLSIYSYYLIGENLLNAIFFGLLLGFDIFVFSMFFITYLNNFILPKLSKKYWLILAILFSYLSGFLGTILTYYFCKIFRINQIEKFENNYMIFALFLGFLTYFVAALLYQFVKMNNKKEYSERLLLDSRLKSLQRQLNPHFLFNSLNSLVELVHIDINKTEDNLMELSRFLRQSMNEKALNSLKDEIDNLKRYVNLENVRFSDNIILHININEDLYDYKIPKFSIQLLVENAIKHGFSKNKESLNIYIEVKKSDSLIILVKNDGKKISSDKFGIGLTNLKERLSILCNGKIHLVNKVEPTYKITIGKCNENINNG